MRTILAVVLVLLSLPLPVAGQGDGQKLQGYWKLTKYEQDGASSQLLRLLHGPSASAAAWS